jgi:hypothetical protein
LGRQARNQRRDVHVRWKSAAEGTPSPAAGSDGQERCGDTDRGADRGARNSNLAGPTPVARECLRVGHGPALAQGAEVEDAPYAEPGTEPQPCLEIAQARLACKRADVPRG